jgi:putative membrane protein
MMYLWIKALHILAIISWMVGLLYLPRLYVYHSMVETGSARDMTFQLMERRLLKAIMNPAMIASFLFGFWMVLLNPDLLSQGWFHIKLASVLLLAGVHGKFAVMRKAFAEGRANRSDRYYRVWNEVPTVLMIIIVIMVVIQPF